MPNDTFFVFCLIGFVAILMASNRVRFDLVALLVVLALMLSGIQTASEALSGFGSPVVILVAALLVIGEMLERTGVAAAMGNWILKRGGGNETKLLIMIMGGAGILGAAMSSTAIVAIFIPILFRISSETKINVSRFLMPMSYAALISGMLTLIATTPNIVVSEELKSAGFDGFTFFSFTPVGLAVLIVAILYMLLVGRYLMPAHSKEITDGSIQKRSIDEIAEPFITDSEVTYVTIPAHSPLLRKAIQDCKFEDAFGITVLGLVRRRGTSKETIKSMVAQVELRTNDVLCLYGKPETFVQLRKKLGLQELTVAAEDIKRWMWQTGIAVILVHPESSIIGKSIKDIGFRNKYGLHVLGLRRAGQALSDCVNQKITTSDSLLVVGPWSKIQQLRNQNRDFIILETPAAEEEIVPSYKKKPVSLIILAVMIVLSILDVVPLVAIVIMAAMAAVCARCLTMEDSYRAIHWGSIVLVAGMLPLADALNSTGGTQLLVDGLLQTVGHSSPLLMFTAIFFLTAILGLFLSNTASAVLVAPIAITAANTLGVSPYPFAVAVLIAASAAFMTPVSTPVVTLIVEPGRYHFLDFVKVGTPLLMLTYLVTLLVTPLVFPF